MSVTLADNASDWVRAMFRSRVTPEDLQNTTKIIFGSVSFDVNEIVDMDGRVYVPQRTCCSERTDCFECGECGFLDAYAAPDAFHYCPGCGRKVVER